MNNVCTFRKTACAINYGRYPSHQFNVHEIKKLYVFNAVDLNPRESFIPFISFEKKTIFLFLSVLFIDYYEVRKFHFR